MKVIFWIIFSILITCWLVVSACGIMLILDKETISIVFGSILVFIGILGLIIYSTIMILWGKE